MKCPQCHSEAISFNKWIQKYYAFNTECDNCGVHLKADIFVYTGFILTIIVSISLIPFLNEIFNFLDIELEYKKLEVLALIPVILLGGIITWFLGGYKVDEDKLGEASVKWSDIESIISPYKRTAWLPKTVEQHSSRISSKFSGAPFLATSESWPCCQHCHKPMQLFVQLNSAHLPKGAGAPFGDGYLQVFYCTNSEKECEIECDAFFPFSKSSLVRVLSLDLLSDTDVINSPVKDAFPEKEIIGWIPHDDFPNGEELDELGCTLNDEQSEFMYEQEFPLPKDKLLGWPYWVQGVEYPECPECGKRMELIFQIDSEDNLPYMFGDVGCSHITQCKEHKDKMAIAWACC